MPRLLLPLILFAPLGLLSCESPRSLETAQMTPALAPIPKSSPEDIDVALEPVEAVEPEAAMIGARSHVDGDPR